MPNFKLSKHPDVFTGLLFMTIGIFFLWQGSGYGFGSMMRMEPGFFPVILSTLVIVVGAAIAVVGFIKASEERFSFSVGSTVRVLGAVAIFAALIQPMGTYLTIPLVVIAAASASSKFNIRNALALAVGMAVAVDVIFRIALGLPLSALGSWMGG